VFTVGDIAFPTKGNAVACAQAINKRATLGQILTGKAGAFFRGLIDLHPNRDKKLARGCIGICIRQNYAIHLDRGPHIVPNDTDIDDVWISPDAQTVPFSYRVTLGMTKNKNNISIAARHTVDGSVKGFAKKAFAGRTTVNCVVTGAPLTRDKCHVDHAHPWPFKRIVDCFFEGSVPEVEQQYRFERSWPFADPDDAVCVIAYRFTDGDVAQRFLTFHDKVAVLHIVSPAVNLGKRDA